jgi:FkbM family methyltransferase
MIRLYRVEIEDGTIIFVRTESDDIYIVREIQKERVYERHFTPAKGSVVVDAGADSGCFALRASRLVGKEGLVLAFEPFSESYSLLEKNLRVNQCTNVKAFHLALGAESTVGRLNVYNKPSYNSLLEKATGDKSLRKIGSEEVRIETLDSVVSKLGLSRIDTLKIDTEGSELYLLRGAVGILKESHPKIVMEIHAYRSTEAGIVDFLGQFGYDSIVERYGDNESLLYAS